MAGKRTTFWSDMRTIAELFFKLPSTQPPFLKFRTFSNIGRLLMEFSSWSVVKGDGAFHGLFVWDRVRMNLLLVKLTLCLEAVIHLNLDNLEVQI
jgi:hypothetical protein